MARWNESKKWLNPAKGLTVGLAWSRFQCVGLMAWTSLPRTAQLKSTAAKLEGCIAKLSVEEAAVAEEEERRSL